MFLSSDYTRQPSSKLRPGVNAVNATIVSREQSRLNGTNETADMAAHQQRKSAVSRTKSPQTLADSLSRLSTVSGKRLDIDPITESHTKTNNGDHPPQSLRSMLDMNGLEPESSRDDVSFNLNDISRFQKPRKERISNLSMASMAALRPRESVGDISDPSSRQQAADEENDDDDERKPQGVELPSGEVFMKVSVFFCV
jgi:hypothetical protein